MGETRPTPLTPIVATLLVVGQLVAAYVMNPHLHWWPGNMTYRLPHATMGVLGFSLLAHAFPKWRRLFCFLAGVGVTWLLGHGYIPGGFSVIRLTIWSLVAGVAMADLLPTGETKRSWLLTLALASAWCAPVFFASHWAKGVPHGGALAVVAAIGWIAMVLTKRTSTYVTVLASMYLAMNAIACFLFVDPSPAVYFLIIFVGAGAGMRRTGWKSIVWPIAGGAVATGLAILEYVQG